MQRKPCGTLEPLPLQGKPWVPHGGADVKRRWVLPREGETVAPTPVRNEPHSGGREQRAPNSQATRVYMRGYRLERVNSSPAMRVILRGSRTPLSCATSCAPSQGVAAPSHQ